MPTPKAKAEPTPPAPSASKAEAAPAPPATAADQRRARLEACRARLQSVELLLLSSPRDALALARGLVNDVVALHAALHLPEGQRASADAETVMRALPDAAAREHLGAARRWLEGAQATGAVPIEGIAALRRMVNDLARAIERTDVTGAAAWRQILRRITPAQAGIAAAVVVVILLGAFLLRSGQSRRVAQFDDLYSQGSAKLTAGDRPQAVELFRKALAVLPDAERSAAAWNDLGWALQQLGQPEEAVRALRKAPLLRPVFPLARNNLGAAQRDLDLKQSEKARPPASR
jgi:tetratricopeptide (TPR) repeat protein